MLNEAKNEGIVSKKNQQLQTPNFLIRDANKKTQKKEIGKNKKKMSLIYLPSSLLVMQVAP